MPRVISSFVAVGMLKYPNRPPQAEAVIDLVKE